jgi:thiamine pyrophosphate-dependent acetolactate synthase large subunit-like protein
MKVCEVMASAFVKEGTTVLFGLLGDGQLGWWSAMASYPQVKIIDVRDEGAALTMAEGWAMTTHKVGVASCTHGPGLTRMFTSLTTASLSHTPIVVFTSRTFAEGGQSMDQERVVSAAGAGYIEVRKPSMAADSVRKAFFRARAERRPIVLCLPLDVQGQNCEPEEDYVTSASLFSGQQRIRPDAARLTQALDIIGHAGKPVILLGRGAMNAETLQIADRLGARLGALISTSLLGHGALGASEYHCGVSGLFATRTAMQYFEESDCVIAVGAGLNTRTLEGGYLYPSAKFVHIDVQPYVVMGTDRAADCYIQADGATALQEIEQQLESRKITKQGYRTPAVRKALQEAHRDPQEFEIEPGTMDPREAMRVIDNKVPADVTIVLGGGHSFTFAATLLKRPRPYTHITSFGCIGQTTPAAIGVAVALEGKPVVHLAGDGGVMQTIQEFDTAARLKSNLLFIVLNDEAYGAEYHKLKAKGSNADLSAVRAPDFAAVGRAFGCRGWTATTPEELAAGIDEFLARPGPMILDARFSRNVVSISYRRSQYAQDV